MGRGAGKSVRFVSKHASMRKMMKSLFGAMQRELLGHMYICPQGFWAFHQGDRWERATSVTHRTRLRLCEQQAETLEGAGQLSGV